MGRNWQVETAGRLTTAQWNVLLLSRKGNPRRSMKVCWIILSCKQIKNSGLRNVLKIVGFYWESQNRRDAVEITAVKTVDGIKEGGCLTRQFRLKGMRQSQHESNQYITKNGG